MRRITRCGRRAATSILSFICLLACQPPAAVGPQPTTATAPSDGLPPTARASAPEATTDEARHHTFGNFPKPFSAPKLAVADPQLFPETAVFDPQRRRLLIGSVRQGAVYTVAPDGATEVLVDDERLCSVLGIAIDESRRRLFVLSNELGVGVRSCAKGPHAAAGVGIYDADTGAALHYVDLRSISGSERLLANAVALDVDGNAYVSDSFASCIYQIPVRGSPRVWHSDPVFSGPGIGLNGIVVHPDGYLLVVKKNDGKLFRIPLDAPRRMTEVVLPQSLIGGDGLLLTDRGQLVVIANEVPPVRTNTAFVLTSDDAWQHAAVREQRSLPPSYPTVPVAIDGALFYLHTQLDELLRGGGADASSGHVANLTRLNLSSGDDHSFTAADTVPAGPGAFVLAQVQLGAGQNFATAQRRLTSVLRAEPGAGQLTWLAADQRPQLDVFIAFDDLPHARHFATASLPQYAKSWGLGQSTKIFDAPATAEASRDMRSPYWTESLPSAPRAYVYTEVQVDVGFDRVPWKIRNPIIRQSPGFLSKTWLSGINTHTVGGLYAFDSLRNAKHFATELFPPAAAKQGAAFSALVFRAAEQQPADASQSRAARVRTTR